MFVVMVSLSIIAIIGLLFKVFLDYKAGVPIKMYPEGLYPPRYKTDPLRITWLEFIVVMMVSSFIIVPIVTKLWMHHAINTKVTYYEYRNGWETDAVVRNTTCTKNGPCAYTYDCDPHLVTYSCNCDDKSHCSTCTKIETDECPYVDTEYSYDVNTTVGEYTIDTHRFPKDPQNHRWRERKEIPPAVIERAGVGEPQLWTEVNNRLLRGRAGYATVIKSYQNYILASGNTILQTFSIKTDKYLKAKLLPALDIRIYDFYKADKVHVAGLDPTKANAKVWNEKLNNLNAAVGPELQGDIHIVLVDANKVTDFDEYVITLRAYWQNNKYFGKYALPKNTIVVVLGTTDYTNIAWSRAFTGMPSGNEKLVVAVNSLKDKPFYPDTILGNVQIAKQGNKTVINHTHGLLEDMLYNKDTRFTRMSMNIKDKSDKGSGYTYLLKDIKPNRHDTIVCIILCIVLSCIGWGITAIANVDGFVVEMVKAGRAKRQRLNR